MAGRRKWLYNILRMLYNTHRKFDDLGMAATSGNLWMAVSGSTDGPGCLRLLELVFPEVFPEVRDIKHNLGRPATCVTVPRSTRKAGRPGRLSSRKSPSNRVSNYHRRQRRTAVNADGRCCAGQAGRDPRSRYR